MAGIGSASAAVDAAQYFNQAADYVMARTRMATGAGPGPDPREAELPCPPRNQTEMAEMYMAHRGCMAPSDALYHALEQIVDDTSRPDMEMRPNSEHRFAHHHTKWHVTG